MNDVIELSSGHVFAAGSVKAVGLINSTSVDKEFDVYGVGFRVTVCNRLDDSPEDLPYAMWVARWEAHNIRAKELRQEAIDKLLK